MASEILECPIDDFLGHYVPFKLSDQSVTAAYDELKNSLLKKVGKKKVWTLTPYAKPPRDHDGHDEPIVFGHLKKIIAALEKVDCADVTGTGRGRLFGYKDSPSTSMASEIQGTNFKVDACITSDPKATTTVLSDVVAVAEYKKKCNPYTIVDNRLKLISAAAQVMNDDPGRMWVYGITIEDTQMTVWYFCRSHSVKSTSFDFTTDIETFIRVFLTLLCATRAEIGYDPTVHRVEHDNKICYVYQVGPRYYRTIDEPLFTARVLCITGRKTRVWRVVEVKGPDKGQFAEEIGEHVVLKDGWLDEGASSEQENQEAIFKRLKNIQSSDYEWAKAVFLRRRLVEAFQGERYKDYYMEILTSRRIRKTKARLQSAKPIPKKILFPKPTSTSSRRNTVDGSTQTQDYSGLPASIDSDHGEEDTSHREYKTKEQHRLIYRHVGCAISSTGDLRTSFRAMHDVFIALVLLYLARWTHRDISAGNIIVLGQGNDAQGKLSDLEYAKEFNDTKVSADPKTGTPFFMPYEIHLSVSLDLQAKSLPVQEVDPFADHQTQVKLPREEQATHPVKFLFHHDLESLWWVMLWIILYRVGGAKALELVEMIFTYRRTPSDSRTRFFLNRKPKLQDHLDDDLKYLASFFVEIQISLVNLCPNKELIGNPFTFEYAQIYEQAWASLTNIFSYVRNSAITFQDPDPELTGSDSEPEVTEKGKRRKQNTKDDHAYRPNRQGSTRGKAVSTGPVNKQRRSVRVARRKVG